MKWYISLIHDIIEIEKVSAFKTLHSLIERIENGWHFKINHFRVRIGMLKPRLSQKSVNFENHHRCRLRWSGEMAADFAYHEWISMIHFSSQCAEYWRNRWQKRLSNISYQFRRKAIEIFHSLRHFTPRISRHVTMSRQITYAFIYRGDNDEITGSAENVISVSSWEIVFENKSSSC